MFIVFCMEDAVGDRDKKKIRENLGGLVNTRKSSQLSQSISLPYGRYISTNNPKGGGNDDSVQNLSLLLSANVFMRLAEREKD